MTFVARLRYELWWLVAGALGMLLVALVGPQLAEGGSPGVRWSGVALLAALGGLTTAVVGPRLLPLAREAASEAVHRGRRLRPLVQGAAVGVVGGAVTAVGTWLFPGVLAPFELSVGRGIPHLLVDQLLWAVPAATVAGALLGVAGWAAVTQRPAVVALGRLLRGVGPATFLVWAAAATTVAASLVTGAVLSEGAAGAGPVAQRAVGIVAAGPWWGVAWGLWGVASIGLLAVLVLLAERVRPTWATVAISVAVVAIAADLVAFALLGAALPVLAPAALAGDVALLKAVEDVALTLSGLVANVLQGVVGLALIRAAGRRLHPLVGLLGLGAFSAVIVSGLVLALAPQWLSLVAAPSIGLYVAFAAGLGWQLAVSRRTSPALEASVRRAARELVPLHPLPFRLRIRDLAAVDLAVDPEVLSPLLPEGLEPLVRDGRAYLTLVGGVMSRARPAFLPAWAGFRDTPAVLVRVPVDDRLEGAAVTFLRGWADGTVAAVATHWFTELQVTRIDLEVRAAGEHWVARGSGGAVDVVLEADDSAPGLATDQRVVRTVAARGGRLADVPVSTGSPEAQPARVLRLRVPALDRLGAEVVGAALLGSVEHRSGRGRWR